jgi:2-dehydropantoate 2-reductase
VVHRSNGFLIAPDGAAGRDLAALYEGTDAGIRLTNDFGSAQWKKLVSNVVANGITALTGRRMEVLRSAAVADLGRAVVREGIVVARAEGADIDDGYADLLIEGIAAMPDDSGTSMLYDRLAGRPLEYDALYGAVVRAADRHGIDVPHTRTLHALLQGLSEGLGLGECVGSGDPPDAVDDEAQGR